MGCIFEIGKSFLQGDGVIALHEHEGHGGTEKDDVCAFVL